MGELPVCTRAMRVRIPSGPSCRSSSMAEHLHGKQETRVRFPCAAAESSAVESGPVAQRMSAPDYESGGWGFESLQGHVVVASSWSRSSIGQNRGLRSLRLEVRFLPGPTQQFSSSAKAGVCSRGVTGEHSPLRRVRVQVQVLPRALQARSALVAQQDKSMRFLNAGLEVRVLPGAIK